MSDANANDGLKSTTHTDYNTNSVADYQLLNVLEHGEGRGHSAHGVECSLTELRELMRLRGPQCRNAIEERYGNVQSLCERLSTDPQNGLSGKESDLNRRRKIYGSNSIPKKKLKNFLWFMWEAFTDLTLIILTIAAIVSFGISFYHPPKHHSYETGDELSSDPTENLEWIEGIAILIAVVVIVIVTAANDYSKEIQFRRLQKSIDDERHFATIRGGRGAAGGVGELIDVRVSELVVGDICQLKYGDTIPADGVLIQSNDMKVDESSFTGESEDIKKSPHTDPALFADTHVMEGSGRMVILCVGVNTQSGEVLQLMGATDGKDDDGDDDCSSKSVLKSKLDILAKQIGYVGIAFASMTFIVLCIRFSVREFAILKHPWDVEYVQDYISFFILAITILVIAIPEGLPLAVMISLAYSVRKMMKDNNLVRHLDACETMGNATTICCDKTGTLTANRMTVVQNYMDGAISKHVFDGKSLKRSPSDIDPLLATAISVNTGYTSRIKMSTTQRVYVGNKTECALLSFILDIGYDYERIRQKFPEQTLHKVYTFNSMRKWMSTVIPRQVEGHEPEVDEDGRSATGYRIFTKGAAEIVLHKCNWILHSSGQIKALSDNDRQLIEHEIINSMASNGLRTMCIAYKDFVPSTEKPKEYEERIVTSQEAADEPDWDNEDEIVSKLICVAIVGIEDPVRAEVPHAIHRCQKAGITVRMVTGDNVNTARSVAIKCGILDPSKDELIMEGPDFNKKIRATPDGAVEQNLIDTIWPQLRVLARSSPQDKYNLVKGIMSSHLDVQQEVVAATGDGTNDGPALKKADVGFAMGITGTDVAKEASDIILLDDNFSSIVKAVVWGRHVYDSIAKFLQFQLTLNVVALVMAFVSACIIADSPITAIQMIWINLIQDTLASLSLATESPSDELLNRKPYGRNKSIISFMMLQNILTASAYQLTVVFVFIFAGEILLDVDNGRDVVLHNVPTQHYTFVFNVFVVMSLFNEINCRKINGSFNPFAGLHRSYAFIIIWLLTFFIQVIVVEFGSVVFFTVALTLQQWMWCMFFGVLHLLFSQVVTGIRCLIQRVRFPTESNDQTPSENVLYDNSVKTDDDRDHVFFKDKEQLVSSEY